jgi:pimeloyl-ACP methyl ester carboxylesterase
MWGFGDTAKNQKYTIEDQTQLIIQFLDKLGIFRIAIVGHGLGGLVALDLAKKMPDVVDRVFAIAVPFTNELITNRLLNINAKEKIDYLFPLDLEMDAVSMDLSKIDQNAIMSISGQSNPIEQNTLENLGVNCLFVHGREDPFVLPPPINMLSQFPEFHHAIIFDQSGHFPMLEENSKFNRLLNDFLSLESGKPMRDLRLKEEWIRRLR